MKKAASMAGVKGVIFQNTKFFITVARISNPTELFINLC
jgi:hypothetical protein